MQILAFDGRMGASGDMLLGALIDAGADRSVLDPVEDALDLTYRIDETTRCGIHATNVRVALSETEDRSEETTDRPHGPSGTAHEHGHTHDHEDHTHDEHEHIHHHAHDHAAHSHAHDDHADAENVGSDDNADAEGAGSHRSYGEVVDIVRSLSLAPSVEKDALAIVRRLGEAEATVHGADLAEIHFHEVGADDAIADIVGATLLMADLDPDRVVTTPIATGSGEVEMSHGTYPIPSPAVVELAADADWQLRGGPIAAELLTPTGAAILSQFADGVERLPTLDLDASGYGAGTKSFDSRPNVLRAIRGETTEELTRDPVTVLETNVDDVTPETLGGLQETLADAGALDVSILPATMKKSRPAHLVKVIVKPEHADRVARRLAIETGTLGVREHGRGHRLIADRETRTVTVDLAGESFDIDVKLARIGESVFDVSAEFDDAQTAADRTNLPVREVMRRSESAAYETFDIADQRTD